MISQLAQLVFGEGAVERLGVGARGRLVGLDVDADLLEELAHVGLAVEDADGAGDGERLREDRLARRGDVVAAARRVAPHRDDERLTFAVSTASRHITSAAIDEPPGALDAEDDGADARSSRACFQRLGDGVRADEVRAEERDVAARPSTMSPSM